MDGRTLQHIATLEDLKKSDVLQELLHERRVYLQRQANMFLRNKKFIEAYAALARHDDIDAFYRAITNKIKQLNSKE